ncbi:DNA mismatch repair protein mlh3, partial [Globisporangium splendens]
MGIRPPKPTATATVTHTANEQIEAQCKVPGWAAEQVLVSVTEEMRKAHSKRPSFLESATLSDGKRIYQTHQQEQYERKVEQTDRDATRVMREIQALEQRSRDVLRAAPTILKYVSFTPDQKPFSVQGYFALIRDSWEVSLAGLKQARAYYQYVFFQNRWIEGFHEECAKLITQLALDFGIANCIVRTTAGIPIFVLKVDCSTPQYDLGWDENGRSIEFRSPECLQQLLYDLLQMFAVTSADQEAGPNEDCSHEIDSKKARSDQESVDVQFEFERDGHAVEFMESCDDEAPDMVVAKETPDECHLCGCESEWTTSDEHLERQSHADQDQFALFYELQPNDPDRESSRRQLVYADDFEAFEDHDIDSNLLHEVRSVGSDEVVFHVEDARTNWGHYGNQEYHNEQDFDGEKEDFACDDHSEYFQESLPLHPPSRDYIEPIADQSTSLIPQNANLKSEYTDQTRQAREEATEVGDRGLASVFFSGTKTPKLAGHPTSSTPENNLWLSTSRLPTAEDDQVDAEAFSETANFTPTAYGKREAVRLPVLPTKHVRSHYFSQAQPTTLSRASPVATQKQARRTFNLKLPRASKCTLRIDNVRELKQLRNFKISRSVLKDLEVIRQVDRKFILVQAHDDTHGNLLFCIDQHAADERVKLEQLELSIFGPDGDDLNIEVHVYQQPVPMLLNMKESQTLVFNEHIVRAWGFDFEVSESDSTEFEPVYDLYASESRNRGGDGDYIVELRAMPKVDTRCANADDLRDFLQLLSRNDGYWSWTTMRPPVITRLLHSRACRSAIMFGDYLSISQCRDLIDALCKCKLPFQCAHGRPSVVPLVEFVTP